MPKGTRPPDRLPLTTASAMPAEAERELIVVTKPGAQLQAIPEGIAPSMAGDVEPISRALSAARATIRPLFEISPARAVHAAALSELMGPPGAPAPPDLSVYFRVDAPDEQLERLAAELRRLPTVEAAYVKPPAMPAVTVKSPPAGVAAVSAEPAPRAIEEINAMLPRAEEAPPVTPDFTAEQLYLGPAPGGIEALWAATQPGGRGTGVRIIDVEGAWRFTHEDLVQNQGGVAAGVPSSDLGWRNHGTAVIGEFGGDVNGFGITGICPDANVRGVSIFGLNSAPAIQRAADLLGPGDIILIELHRPGPNATGVGQRGFIAMEWWPDDYDAIRYATSRGVIVVEAAGNGSENLDDPAYDVPAPGFPPTWSNPFRRGARDSGAILVGAGAPPPGTHGRDHGPDRSRLDFSNYGSAVDAQGWGREVTTTGYGDRQGGTNEDFWYTNLFSGTSSASPIVVGALASTQGNRRARGAALLTPATARNLLRTTGSPQQDAPARPATQRIGTRPNLRQMIGVGVAVTVPLFRYWNPNNTDHFYTTNWSELGGGRYGWNYEGIQCYVIPQRVPGSVPLHRYWNAQIGDHFYTTNWNELGSGRYGWAYEGIQCYVYPQPAANRVPLYRYWNRRVGDHFYTTNWNELGLGRYGWRFEGIQCYVATQVRPPGVDEAESSHIPQLDTAMPSADQPATAAPQAADDAMSGIPQSFAAGAGESSLGVPTSFAGAGEMTSIEAAPGSFTTFTTGGVPDSFQQRRTISRSGTSITIRVNEEGE